MGAETPEILYSLIGGGNGETLEVVKMYGKRWFKLKTTDDYQGWIRVYNFEMSGYDDIMYIDAWDIFDGIVVAG